jgi:hypothetical protein
MSDTACDILKNYIESKNGNVTYGECLYFLNNRTYLSQIQIGQCLNFYFPRRIISNNWIGIA